jgi:general secretion pathway protein B
VAPASATPAPRAATAPAPTSPAGSSAAPAETPLLSGLPEDLRRQIPALAITGVVHADNPAQRLLVVNNQVLTQDGQLGPDLVLETIGSRHSVFRFRGTRFRVANQ